MKKTLILLVPMIVLSALLFCLPAYAQETEPQYTVEAIDLKEDNLDRFIELGQTPDFTNAEFIVTYSDGSFETVLFDPSHLVSWDISKKGRQPAVLNIKGVEHTEFFVVSDPSVNVLDFTDVTKAYWGYKQIRRAVQAGFFVGLSKTEFGVAYGMTRAQFCQMIYNIYKTDPTVFVDIRDVSFTDVPEGMWYYEAVMACARAGIVAGMGDGTFLPEANITRQDVAVIMMSVLEDKDTLDTLDIEAAVEKARQNGIAAGDFDSVSPYAQKYVASALGVIYYGDSEGNINPKNNITRTECAAMCTNLFFDNDKNEAPEKKIVYLSPESDTSKVYAIWNKNDPSTHTYTEHTQMSIVADKAKAILEEMGYIVYIADVGTPIRDKDKNDNPQYYRGQQAAELGADCYISLHTNAAGSSNSSGKTQGTTCYYNGNNKGAKELSDILYKHVGGLTPTNDLGSRDDMLTSKPFAEVRLPTMANVLIEVEFHDYAPYAQWIVNNTDAIAKSLADGIDEYFKTLE